MKISPSFRRALTEIHDGAVLLPIIRGELARPDFEGFTVPVEAWAEREPDGWFHPSEHATWSARQLALYAARPQLAERERPQLTSILAMTQGKFWHTFFQTLLAANGILTEAEKPLTDPGHNRRGHMDGLLSTGEGFELKTMAEHLIHKVKTVEDLREHHPGYYAQAQDYLDMAGLAVMRMVIMSPANPYPMTELAIEADEVFQAAQRRKYRQALAAATGIAEELGDTNAGVPLPEACCVINSKESKTCPVRLACPIGSKK